MARIATVHKEPCDMYGGQGKAQIKSFFPPKVRLKSLIRDQQVPIDLLLRVDRDPTGQINRRLQFNPADCISVEPLLYHMNICDCMSRRCIARSGLSPAIISR